MADSMKTLPHSWIEEESNRVDTLTAVCRRKYAWNTGQHDELEIGKTYKVTHISVFGSWTMILLAEFGLRMYNTVLFDLYENGVLCKNYAHDPRFLSPSRRAIKSRRAERNKRMKYKHLISDDLEQFEQKHHVKILFAAAGGSQAMGLSSTDSDWDLRVFYVHRPEWYLSGSNKQNSISQSFSDNIELIGWDLRMVITEFQMCHMALMECLQSPLIYRIHPVFKRYMHELEQQLFHPQWCMRYFLLTYALNNSEPLPTEEGLEYPLKQLIFYLKGVLSCKWIEEKGSFPPVDMQALVDTTVTEENARREINHLLQLKRDNVRNVSVSGNEETDRKEHSIDKALLQQIAHWYSLSLQKASAPEATTGSPIPELSDILWHIVKAIAAEEQEDVNDKADEGTLRQTLRAFQGATERASFEEKMKELANQFKSIAECVFFGGYFLVNQMRRIYPLEIEFYYHEEQEDGLKDPVMYHTDDRQQKQDLPLPYYELGALNWHISGLDVTFENEQKRYRASFLIRKYQVKEWQDDEWVTLKTKEERSTYLYEDMLMNGSLFEGFHLQWKDEKEPHPAWVPAPKPRINVAEYKKDALGHYVKDEKGKYEKEPYKKCNRPWRYNKA